MPEPRALGFIGLGNIGGHMAANLMAAGHLMTVYDIREEAARELLEHGASWADSPRQVAASSDVVFISLPGPAQVEETFTADDGLLAGSRPGTYVIDVSTNSPSRIRGLGVVASGFGVKILDAPVSGGVRGARKGTLTIMVGGEQEAFEYCEPLLRIVGENVIHVGPLGAGHVTKLVNNFMGISNAIASMEAMAMGVGAGVDPNKLLEVVNLGTGSSHMSRTLYPYLILNRNFDPVRFSMELAVKDLHLALELAEELGLTVRVGQTVHDALLEATEHGLAGADMSRYITLLEKSIGIEVRG
jgi:3-hydroxyisobutyrate dehydrogenase